MEGPFSIDPTSGIMTLVGPLDKSRVSYIQRQLHLKVKLLYVKVKLV